MLEFFCARVSYMNADGNASSSSKNSAAPGEWYKYRDGHYRIGIILHLVTCLPAFFLAVWPFVTVIRRKASLFHRLNGYAVIILVMLSNTGALMVARRVFGGGLDVQSAVGTLAILTIVNLPGILQHQVPTDRLASCLDAENLVLSRHHHHHSTDPNHLNSHHHHGQRLLPGPNMWRDCILIYEERRVQCNKASSIRRKDVPLMHHYRSNTPVLVNANLNGQPEQIDAALGLSFGAALWLALALHAVGIEL